MTTIYIVQGSTGEYSDHREWFVDAWTSEAAAQNRITQLDRLMQETNVNGEYEDYDEWGRRLSAMQNSDNGDPLFQRDYTGTHYSYAPCELKTAPTGGGEA